MPDSSTKWRVLISIVLVAVILAIGAGAFKELAALRQEPTRNEATVLRASVDCVQLARGPFREVLIGYAKARALRASDVAAEVGGRIVWIAPELEAGADVSEGAELIRIDDRDHAAEIARTTAAMAQAAATSKQHATEREGLAARLVLSKEELSIAEEDLARAEELSGDDTVSRQERDARRRTRNTLKRAVLILESRERELAALLEADSAAELTATAARDRAQLDLDRCVIRAPYAARIKTRMADLGGRVAPGSPVFSLVDVSRVEVPVELPASRFGEVMVGAGSEIRLREGGAVHWMGDVTRVSPEVDPDNRTFEVFLEVTNDPIKPVVPPGAFAIASVQGFLHEDVIAVPRVAFVGELVYVAAREHEGATEPDRGREAIATRRRPIIARLLPDYALISGGLEPGDEVIVTNLEQVGDQSRIVVNSTRPLSFSGHDVADELEIGDGSR